jgi:trehalose-phosphatase
MEVSAPGGEPRSAPAAEPFVPAIHEFVDRARALAARWPGMVVEDKRIVVSVHFRNTADPQAARRAIEDEIVGAARARGLAVGSGHKVVEVRPPLALSKGTAVADLLAGRDLTTTAFCGDDFTDMTAFTAVREWAAAAPARRAGYAIVAVTAETPAPVRAAADVAVAATPGVLAVLERLVAATETRGCSRASPRGDARRRPLLACELGGALLEKRVHALGAIGAGEQKREQVAFDLAAAVDVDTEGVVRRALDGAQRQGRLGGQLAG